MSAELSSLFFHCLSHADSVGREASWKMRFGSGTGEVSVRKFEKAMNPGVLPDREPLTRAAVQENQMAGPISNEAFQSKKKARVRSTGKE